MIALIGYLTGALAGVGAGALLLLHSLRDDLPRSGSHTTPPEEN